ncbi:hypothetical protein NQ318_020341 [Aromia moschata]|uniref:TOG domain-containing protein n=1 Tax=Aromia moschata TaxID=1265417 RepID=A0AAV8XE77_9CUCU|nr:hypothetical protein NQ318_020341 [Aromia moschata]
MFRPCGNYVGNEYLDFMGPCPTRLYDLASKSAPVSSRKKEEDVDTSPLLVVNNLKHQRTIDESKLKVLKWNFTQPREEFVDLLKDQMASRTSTRLSWPICSIQILGISLLNNNSIPLSKLQQEFDALISNLDLILKWLTLRFFDTNPSVLLKGLEYLHSVFNMLIDTQYHMLENEASSFIPYLVLKIGDPKDSVRNGVKALLNRISRVYPVSKLFTYVMEGIKSKNARQRAECLDVMGSIIEDFGITVCMPSPAACLKEVAKQISDRDNSVRNAALNCVVQAYNIVGEKVYKMVGNISDKDMSLLEERIKRSSRKTISKPKAEFANATITMTTAIPPQNGSPNRSTHSNQSSNSYVESNDQSNEEEMEEEDHLPAIPVPLPPQIVQEPPKEVEGPFRFDPEFMRELDNMHLQYNKPKLHEFNLDFLKEDVKIPSINDAKAKAITPPKPMVHSETMSRLSVNLARKSLAPKTQDLTLERVIKQISSQNSNTTLVAIAQLHDIMPTPRGNLLSSYEDDFMNAIISQLRFLQSQDPIADTVISKVYRNLLTVMDSFYHNKMLGGQVSVGVIKELLKRDDYFAGRREVIERSDHTNTICGLVKLINECISNDSSPRQVDLVMKCLWRVIKLMPSWGDEIDYDSVLLEVHDFLKKFPSSWWKTKEVDTPPADRQDDTALERQDQGGHHHAAPGQDPEYQRVRGRGVHSEDSQGKTGDFHDSLKITDIHTYTKPAETQRRSLSRANHNMLTDIFQKIGSKDDTKEGLNLLYDFMQDHAEADIEPFLKKSSKFFQDYIRNGLKEIEESRKTAKSTIVEKVGNRVVLQENIDFASLSAEQNEGKGPDCWKEKLYMWNDKFEGSKVGKRAAATE